MVSFLFYYVVACWIVRALIEIATWGEFCRDVRDDPRFDEFRYIGANCLAFLMVLVSVWLILIFPVMFPVYLLWWVTGKETSNPK